ncbi:MAG: DUF6776 family protein [Rhodanobacteraceae bacterium]
MASTIFHHWLDRFHALPKATQRLLRGVLWALGIVAVFFLGIAAGRGFGFPDGLEARAHKLAARNAALQDQIQGLQQQQQTASTALAALRASLVSRDDELQKLKQEQTFYSKLIGIDSDRSGLGVHSIALTPVTGTNAWNFVVTLVNTAENADPARGNLTLEVEGVRNGKLTTVEWSTLAAPAAKDGVPFAFKFFQQLRGSFMLPKGFVPNRVTITLRPQGGASITRELDWQESLAGRHGITLTTP